MTNIHFIHQCCRIAGVLRCAQDDKSGDGVAWAAIWAKRKILTRQKQGAQGDNRKWNCSFVLSAHEPISTSSINVAESQGSFAALRMTRAEMAWRGQRFGVLLNARSLRARNKALRMTIEMVWSLVHYSGRCKFRAATRNFGRGTQGDCVTQLLNFIYAAS